MQPIRPTKQTMVKTLRAPNYSDGVTDLECSLHSSFADLYVDLIRKYPKGIVQDIFVRVRDITTFNSMMLRGDDILSPTKSRRFPTIMKCMDCMDCVFGNGNKCENKTRRR